MSPESTLPPLKIGSRTLPNPLHARPTIQKPNERKRMPLAAIGTGLKTTLSVFFRKPVTYQYPEQKMPVAERYRGRIGLELDLCIGCTLCAQACPNGTCFMVDHKYEKTEELAKKFPNRRDIMPAVEISRCIYCSLCEEVCPTGAIHMTPEYELAKERRTMVYSPDLLQMTEAEIDAMDPAELNKRLDIGNQLILENDKKRV
jgi:NADH-quinone oxidoreductase subunit I